MHLSLTGRCNFNCRHCFNARDIHPRSVEPRLDQLIDLLNQMDACGVGRLRLDGGEALTRPDFLCFTDEMSKRGIRLQDSSFLRQIRMTCGELKAGNPECQECSWRGHCSTGCRAEALTQGNGINGPDRRMCLFFKNGYYERLLALAQQV